MGNCGGPFWEEEPEVLPPVVRGDQEENIQAFYDRAEYIAKKYQTFNAALIWGSHWEKAYFTRGIENFLADLAAFPELSQELLNYIINLNMEILPKIAACPHVDGILLGSDWGTQNDLIMSPVTWRERIKPGEKKEYELLKHYNKKVMVHSCGQILRVMADLVELGVDILNPVQPEYVISSRPNPANLPYAAENQTLIREEIRMLIKACRDHGEWRLFCRWPFLKSGEAEVISAGCLPRGM